MNECYSFITDYVAACVPQRYVLGVMGLLGMANSYIMRACLSIAITAMVVHKTSDQVVDNEDLCPVDDGLDNHTSTGTGGMPKVSCSSIIFMKHVTKHFSI